MSDDARASIEELLLFFTISLLRVSLAKFEYVSDKGHQIVVVNASRDQVLLLLLLCGNRDTGS